MSEDGEKRKWRGKRENGAESKECREAGKSEVRNVTGIKQGLVKAG